MAQTDIILLERIKNLGRMGDLVKVKPGYARNFLLPQGKAMRATKENRARYEAEKEAREAANLANRRDAEVRAKDMRNLSVVLIRAASESGQLYGSATSRDIATAITEAGFATDRNQVEMNRALKSLGLFPIRIAIHPEVVAEVVVNIARSKDEAAKQLQLGRAIVADDVEAAAGKRAKGDGKTGKPQKAKASDRGKRDGKPSPTKAKPEATPTKPPAKPPAKTSDKTPAKTLAKTSGKTPAKTKADVSGAKPATPKTATKTAKPVKKQAAKPAKSLMGRLFGGKK